MLYELATGKFPYPKAENHIEMIDNIMNLPEPRLNEQFSPEFQDFIAKCVKRNPAERATIIQLAAHPWALRYSMHDVSIPRWIAGCMSVPKSE